MMKKALLAFAIVAFVACNNESKPEEAKTDTAATVAPAVDTAAKPVVDTAAKPVVDSAAKK